MWNPNRNFKVEGVDDVTRERKEVHPQPLPNFPSPPASPVRADEREKKPSIPSRSRMMEEAKRKIMNQQAGPSTPVKGRPRKVERAASHPPLGPSGTIVSASANSVRIVKTEATGDSKPKLNRRSSAAESKFSVPAKPEPLPPWLVKKRSMPEEKEKRIKIQKAKRKRKEENAPGFDYRYRHRHSHQTARQMDFHLYASGESSPQERQKIIQEWMD